MSIFTATKNMKSRVKGDFHARFCENVGVKFPCVTRLAVMELLHLHGHEVKGNMMN